MASHPHRLKQVEDLWDRVPQKFLVYVMEGVSLVTKSGAGNPYVKLSYDKQRAKTESVKGSEDPTWKELFFFEAISDVNEVLVEVYTKQVGIDKLIGICKLIVPVKSPDNVIDVWVDLQIPPKTSQKSKDILDGRIGNIHFRVCYSSTKETPPPIPFNEASDFFYDQHKSKFKTGDLIAFNGIGTLDTITKITSNSKYSRLGMVISMPNKFTGKDKLYLFEVGRNVGKMADAFSEQYKTGACLFRLEERLHAVTATEAYWVAIKEPLDKTAGEHNMKDYLWELHEGRERLPDLVMPHSEVVQFFREFEFALDSQKHIDSLCELNSTTIMVNALRLGGKRFNFEKEYYPPVQLLALNVFEEPVLLRKQKEGASFTEDPQKRRMTVSDDKRLTDASPRSESTGGHQRQDSLANSQEVVLEEPKSGHHSRSPSASAAPALNTTQHQRQPSSSGTITTSEDSTSYKKAETLEIPALNTTSSRRALVPAASAATPPPPQEPPVANEPGSTVSSPPSPEVAPKAAPSPKVSRPKSPHANDNPHPAVPSPVVAGPVPPEPSPQPVRARKFKSKTNRDRSATEAAKVDSPHTPSKSLEAPPVLVSKSAKKKRPTLNGKKAKATRPETQSLRLSNKYQSASLPSGEATAKVLFDFVAENQGELGVTKGMDVVVLDADSDADWALVRNTESKQIGCVPKSYIKLKS